MRKGIYLVVTLLFFPSAIFGEARYKIGVSVPLSGEAATYGDDIKNVITFANEKLGGGKFELIFEDDKCSGKEGVSVARKFVDVDRVSAVIGFGCSGVLLSAAPVYERAAVLAMGTVCSASDISHAGDYIFRTQPSDASASDILYSYLAPRHKVFGMISEETDYAQGLARGLAARNAKGSMIVVNESFLTSDMDLKPQLLRLKQKQIDGLFLNGQTESSVHRILKYAKEVGLRVPLYSVYFGASSSFLDLAQEDAEGLVVVDGPVLSDILNEEGKELFSEFTAQFGPMKSWEYGFVNGFEAFRALSLALASRSDPKKFLYQTKFQGLFGAYAFDGNGDILGLSLVLKRVSGGKVTVLSRQ